MNISAFIVFLVCFTSVGLNHYSGLFVYCLSHSVCFLKVQNELKTCLGLVVLLRVQLQNVVILQGLL